MFGWLVRIVMSIAAVITGWFVVRDAAIFGVVQMAVSLLLIAFFVAVAAFWPSLATWFRSRHKPEDRTKP